MAKKKTRTEQARLVVERLLRDEEVQGHLRTATTRLQEAGARVRARRGADAVEDKKLYTKVREAATSLTKAQRSLRAEPEPTKRGRKLVALAGLGGAVAFALKKRQGSQTPTVEPAVQFNDQPATPVDPRPVPLGA